MSAQEHSMTNPNASAIDHSNRRTSYAGNSENPNLSQGISLLNFNPSSQEKKFITSPRSKEALRRVGFEDHELLTKTKEDFANQPIPAEFADDGDYFLEVKSEHYEKRRKEKLKAAIQEREKIIKEEGKKSGNISTNQDTHNDTGFQSQYGGGFGNEMRKIQQMKNQQKKEIEYIIQNELKVQEMHKKNEDKLMRMEEMEQKRRLELEEKQKEAEFAKMKREAQRLEREKEQEELSKALAERQRQEELRRKEVQDKLAQDRHQEAIMKEKLRREKSLMRELKMEEMDALYREYAEKQRQERELKLVRIKEQTEEKQRIKQKQSDEARKNFEFKIKVVRQKYDDDKEEQRRRVLQKQNYTNSKREKFEETKKNQLEQRRNLSEARTQEIKMILEEKFEQERMKKIAYLDKYRKAEENKKLRDEEQEKQRLMKIQKEVEKEHKIKQVLSEYQLESQVRNDIFLKTLSQEQMRAERQKEQLLKGLKRKYIIDMLRMEDAEENNKRLDKLREDRRNFLSDKITQSTQKIQQIQADKEKAFLEKKKIQDKLEAEKAEVLKDFEKKKKLLLSNKIPVGEMSTTETKPDAFQKTMYKTPLHTTKSQPKLLPYQEKVSTRSTKNGSMNKTAFIDANESSSHNLLSVEPPSKSFVSNRNPPETRKGSQLHHDFRLTSTKKEEIKMPRHLRASPYNRINKMPNTISKDNKALLKVANASMSHKEDTVIMDLQNQEYKKAAEETRKVQLNQVLEMLNEALREDKDEQKVDSYIGSIIESSKKNQEEIANLRKQKDFLFFA